MSEIIPLTNIESVEEVVQFYQQILGFVVKEFHKGQDDRLTYVILGRGSNQIICYRDEVYTEGKKAKIHMIVDSILETKLI